MPEHVCDPSGDPCPPWAHPYPSTDEILYRQNRAAAEREVARASQPSRQCTVTAPAWSVASRTADGLLTQLERLARNGYRVTEEQEWRLRRLAWTGTLTLPASAWEGSAIPPQNGGPDPDLSNLFEKFAAVSDPMTSRARR